MFFYKLILDFLLAKVTILSASYSVCKNGLPLLNIDS